MFLFIFAADVTDFRRISLEPPPPPLLLLLLLLLRWPRAADAMYEDWGELRAGISKHAEEGKAQKGGWRCGVCGEVVSTYRDSAACDDASAEARKRISYVIS